jgi:endonuclease III
LRAGPAGVIGLDYQEMRQAIEDLGLYRSRSLEQKIKALERELLENVGK